MNKLNHFSAIFSKAACEAMEASAETQGDQPWRLTDVVRHKAGREAPSSAAGRCVVMCVPTEY